MDNKYGILEFQEGLAELLNAFHFFCVKNEIIYGVDGNGESHFCGRRSVGGQG